MTRLTTWWYLLVLLCAGLGAGCSKAGAAPAAVAPESSDPGFAYASDAAAEGEPGTVNCFGLEDTGQRPVLQPIGSHLTTPDALLAMAGELFGRRPPATMVTIVGESFEVSEALTPVVAAAVPEAVECITALGSSPFFRQDMNSRRPNLCG